VTGVETAEAIQLEPETETDVGFLRRVFDSTREREMDLVDWSEVQREAFLAMQFQAQRRHYRDHFPDADFRIVSRRGERMGRLCTHRSRHEIRIVDIALLPESRGKGIGTALVGQILDEADQAGIPVRIHVEKTNPAQRLYRDLGFRAVEDRGMHWLMERNASR